MNLAIAGKLLGWVAWVISLRVVKQRVKSHSLSMVLIFKEKVFERKWVSLILPLRFEDDCRSPTNIFEVRASASDSFLKLLLSLGLSVSSPKLALHHGSRQNVRTNAHAWGERVVFQRQWWDQPLAFLQTCGGYSSGNTGKGCPARLFHPVVVARYDRPRK
jgi:hypothetical protein